MSTTCAHTSAENPPLVAGQGCLANKDRGAARRVRFFAAAPILAVALAGCIKTDTTMTISKNSKVSGSAIVAFASSNLKLLGMTNKDFLAQMHSGMKQQAIPMGFKLADYVSGDWVGMKITFTGISTDDLVNIPSASQVGGMLAESGSLSGGAVAVPPESTTTSSTLSPTTVVGDPTASSTVATTIVAPTTVAPTTTIAAPAGGSLMKNAAGHWEFTELVDLTKEAFDAASKSADSAGAGSVGLGGMDLTMFLQSMTTHTKLTFPGKIIAVDAAAKKIGTKSVEWTIKYGQKVAMHAEALAG